MGARLIPAVLRALGEDIAAMPMLDRLSRMEQLGWLQVRQKGSHRQFHHLSKSETVTVSGKPSVDVPPGTLNSVLKQAGFK